MATRTLDVDDLRRIVEDYPELRDVSWRAIDDEVASVLAELKQVEVVYAKSLTLTEPGLQSFREFRKLKLLVTEGVSGEALNDLVVALPNCEVRVNAPSHWRIASKRLR
jgi:hypothetical protein